MLRGRGVFRKKMLRFLPPRGDTKMTGKSSRFSHTPSNNPATARGVGHVATQQHREHPAPVKAKEAYAVPVKRRPRGRARRRRVPHLLRSRFYSADRSHAFSLRALHWSVRWGPILFNVDWSFASSILRCLGCLVISKRAHDNRLNMSTS